MIFFSHFKRGIAICQTIPATYQNTQGIDSVRDPNNATEGICKYFFSFPNYMVDAYFLDFIIYRYLLVVLT